MNTKMRRLAIAVLVAGLVCAGPGRAETMKPGSIEYKTAVQRAAQAAIWAMPAVGIVDILIATKRDLGGDVNDVVYVSKPFTSRHGFLTPNNQVPYVIASLTTKQGPLVVEVPPAAEKTSYFGTFVDAWQTPIEDVGPPGADKGKGAKYIFLPPGYGGEVPDGYLVYRPKTFSVNFAFRPVSKNGGTVEEAVAYAKKLKVYPLAEAANPKPTKFIDAYPKKWNTLPVYDLTFFEDINEVVQNEPVLERDKAVMGLLEGIGIVRGKPFEPGPVMKQALQEGLDLAYQQMQSVFVTPGKALAPYWEGRHWQSFNLPKEQAKAGFPFVTEDRVLIDERAGGAYFWLTYLPKKLGDGSFYLTGLRDKDGNLLDGQSTYRLRVPKDVPAKDFWSAIVYSMKTKGFVENADRVGLSSFDTTSMKANDDGTLDIYFAPQPPKGLESNWIPTGEDFFLIFRLYGPEKALFDKSWVLDDVEKVP